MPTTASLPSTFDGAAKADEKRDWQEKGREERREIHFPARAIPLSGFIPEPVTNEELQLVQKLFFLRGKEVPRVIVFCGVEPGDGAEPVCARSAEVLSELVKEEVCLMDANLRAPTFHLRYCTDGRFRPSVMKEAESGKDCPMRDSKLWVIPASALKECRPGLALDQARDRVTRLRETFGFLLICAPPLDTSAEALLLGQMADGVVLTVMAHSTQRAKALQARRSLETYNIKLLGVVMNEFPSRAVR